MDTKEYERKLEALYKKCLELGHTAQAVAVLDLWKPLIEKQK